MVLARLGAVAAVVCCALFASVASAQPHVVEAPPLTPAEQLTKFKVPPGFVVELVAAEPEIRKPINLNFDDQGRVLATCSVEYPFPVKPAAGAARGEGRDYVARVEGLDASGKATKVTRYVEGLNIPIGIAPTRKGVVVFSIPSILNAVDADGDGVCEQKTVLYDKFGSDDTHGMSSSYHAWNDGWIYACHGFRNTSSVKGADGQAITMSSGNTYRFRPDGSHVEQFTYGQINPFGLAFDPLGNLYSADCHSRPLYALLKGGQYPGFGRPHDGLGFVPEICRHSHGSTGIAGVVVYSADQFPEEYQGRVFIGNPITAKVNQDLLKWAGATPNAVEQPDFLSCSDPWFRPVDVRMGPDGALYIADFYNCIIGHYEVPLDHPKRDRERGRIWRVVYKGADGKAPLRAMPDLEQAKPEELVALLADPNLLVRTKTVNQLVDRVGAASLDLVKKVVNDPQSNPWSRAHGLWVIARLAGLDAELAGKLALDTSPLVRTHALKALGETARTPEALATLSGIARERLRIDTDPFVRMAAAEALGQDKRREHLFALLNAWSAASPHDVLYVHTLRMAMRDQLRSAEVVKMLIGPEGDLARAVKEGKADIIQRLAEVCIGAPTPESALVALEALQSSLLPGGQIEGVVQFAARNLASDQLGPLYTAAEAFKKKSAGEQRAVLRALVRGHQERGAKLPEATAAWAKTLAADLLAREDEGDVRQGIELAQELKLGDAYPQVAAVAAGSKFGGLRGPAIDCCVALDGGRSVPVLAGVIAAGNEPLPLRQKAATSLAAVNNDPARAELAKLLRTAPTPVAQAIAAGLAGSKPGAELLLAAVADGKASPRLLQERNVQEPLKRSNPDKLNERLAKLTAGLPAADDRLKQLIEERRKGFKGAQPDLALGAKAFERVCAKCHQVEGKGAKIGPQLDGIGLRGVERVLEDVLDPSRNVDGAFRTTRVTTNDGRILAGLVLRTDGQVLVLADAEGKEVRVQLADIDERGEAALSPMPANVPELVPEAEFYHLLGYLLAQKQAIQPPAEKK